MKRFAAVIVFLLIFGIGAPVEAQPTQNVLGPTYLATRYGILCNGSDETGIWNSMTSTISSMGGGWIDFSSCTANIVLSSGRITMPANVHIKGPGRATWNPATGHFIPPRSCLDLQFNDSAAKLFYPNAGVNVIQDTCIIDSSNDTAPFILTTNADLRLRSVSILGTKACSGGTCGSGISNKGMIFGGAAMPLTSVDNSFSGNTVYHGTIANGAGNALVGEKFIVYGFMSSANNNITTGFTCTASTATTLTLNNGFGVSETNPGNAIDSSYSATLPTSYFSGYGAGMTDVLMDQVSTAVEISTNANQVFVHDLLVQQHSGNPSGSAILVNGNGNQAVADYLDGIAAEVTNYKYGAEWLSNSNHKATNSTISNFSCWDATATTTACLHFDSNSSGNHGDLAFYNFNGFGVSPIGIKDDSSNNDIFDPHLGWFGSQYAKNYIYGTYASDMNHSDTLSSGVAQTVLQMNLPAGAFAGGFLNYTILASDGTNVCVVSGTTSWQGENTGGSLATSPSGAPGPTASCGGGKTLTHTWTLTATNPAKLQVTATSSITPTSFFITYTWNNQAFISPTY